MPIADADIRVIAPNLKRRLSGVTATIARLVPLMAGQGVVSTGPAPLPGVPHIPLSRTARLPRDRWRVWHARRNTEMLAGLILTRVLRRRYRLVFTSASQRVHTGYTRWLISQMDAVIATSGRTAGYLHRDATVILHGIDTNGFSPPADRAAIRARLRLPEGRLVGCYGRIRAQKGTDVFVDAMIETCRAVPDAIGVVMGRATEGHREFLADQTHKVAGAGLADRILFRDEVPVGEMADWYRALDLFTAPQRWEGFGLTPLESMACGVPVVATRVGAFEEIVRDDTTGRLIPPGEVAPMRDAIHALLSDDVLRGGMGTAARADMEDRFRLEREATELMAVYDRLLGTTRMGRGA